MKLRNINPIEFSIYWIQNFWFLLNCLQDGHTSPPSSPRSSSVHPKDSVTNFLPFNPFSASLELLELFPSSFDSNFG